MVTRARPPGKSSPAARLGRRTDRIPVAFDQAAARQGDAADRRLRCRRPALARVQHRHHDPPVGHPRRAEPRLVEAPRGRHVGRGDDRDEDAIDRMRRPGQVQRPAIGADVGQVEHLARRPRDLHRPDRQGWNRAAAAGRAPRSRAPAAVRPAGRGRRPPSAPPPPSRRRSAAAAARRGPSTSRIRPAAASPCGPTISQARPAAAGAFHRAARDSGTRPQARTAKPNAA